MRISNHIHSKLAYFQDIPGEKKDKQSYSVLHWIAIGIQTGQITGEKSEINDLISSFLTDNADVADTNHKGITPICNLFPAPGTDSIYKPTHEVKENMIFVFKLFFEKNKLAIIKSALIKNEDDDILVPAESAIERIAKSPDLLQELKPELDNFIMEYAASFNEIELRFLVHVFHDNQEFVQKLISALSLDSLDMTKFERNLIQSDKLNEMVCNHWHPDHKGDAAYFYRDFPSLEWWRLFVDGDKQIEESGWALYEAREKGCIDKLYQSWQYMLNSMNTILTPDLFRIIHAICAKGIAGISGDFRKHGTQFGITVNSMSFLGYLEFIQHYSHLCELEKTSQCGFYALALIAHSQINATIEEIIAQYESKITTVAKNPIALLKAIIVFCKQLELTHPFTDCNNRLFCNLILNRELMLNGFSPVLMDNPNRLEGLSLNESLYEIIRGMNNFQQLRQDGRFKNSKITSEIMQSHTYPIVELFNVFQRSVIKHKESNIVVKTFNFFPLLNIKLEEGNVDQENRCSTEKNRLRASFS